MFPDDGNRTATDGPRPRQVPERLLYPVDDVAVLLGTSGRNVRRLMDEGRLEITRLDGRRYIHRDEVLRFIADLPTEIRGDHNAEEQVAA